MATVSLASAKGGVGKSSLAILIGSHLCLTRGWKIALLDSDLNQHAAAFGRKAKIGGFTVLPDITAENILPTLRKAEGENDAVIIDLAGGSSTLALMALQRSHFVLVPTQTSLPDTRDALKTVAQIDNAQELARMPIGRALIWTRVPTQFESRESRHLRKSLEGRGVHIFKTVLMERNSIRIIHMTGKVPLQVDANDKGATNVAEITDELVRHLALMEEDA